MRLLALIAARGGSKRLPNKNIRLLGHDPLIVWSIKVAQDISEVEAILVSTDDAAIARIARSAGALVPWLRPAELATDDASSFDVCLHALDWYEGTRGAIDGLLLLQPTSPFRRRATVLRGIRKFADSGYRPIIGVSPAHSHPSWCFKLENDLLVPFMGDQGLRVRSQDLVPAYAVNGAFYLIRPQELRGAKSFFTADAAPLVMEELEESLDIDTPWDWKLAEFILSNRESEPK